MVPGNKRIISKKFKAPCIAYAQGVDFHSDFSKIATEKLRLAGPSQELDYLLSRETDTQHLLLTEGELPESARAAALRNRQ